MSNGEPVLVLCRDLLFQSRITATARESGVAVMTIRNPDALTGVAGRLLIVDLNQAGTIEAAGAWRTAAGRKVIGFVSHVDAATATAAKAAGVDRVMARSAFVTHLAEILTPT